MNIDELELAWIAGLLEGEGSFLLRQKRTPVIACSMTDKDVIDKLHSLIGGNVYELGRQKEHHKDVFRVQLCGKEAFFLMKKIKPFMGQRRQEQIQFVIDGWMQYKFGISKKDEQFQEKIKEALRQLKETEKTLAKIAVDVKLSPKTIRKYRDINISKISDTMFTMGQYPHSLLSCR